MRLQLLVFFLVTVIGVSYTGLNYVGLIKHQYTVYAMFPDSGGIFQNADVAYRGVHVGRVGKLHLTSDGVRVALHIQDDTRIPKDTTAAVRLRSAVGEQYVDLIPDVRKGPYLRDGAVIPRARTRLPARATTVLVNLDQLVDSVPDKKLVTVIDELDKAFKGTGPDLQRLIDSGNSLVEAAQRNSGPTIELLDHSETVLRTQRESAGDIKTFSRHLASLTDQLRESDTDVRHVLERGVPVSVQTTLLLDQLRPTLPILLGNLVTAGQIMRVRLPQLRMVLILYPMVVAGAFTVAPGDGTAHFGLVANVNAPPPCNKGYERVKHRYPQDTGPKRAPKNVYCKLPHDRQTDVRGTRNAPGPTGVPAGAQASQSTASTTSASTGATGQSGSPNRVLVARYDPATGQLIGPDDLPFTLGSVGGQQRVLGGDSWKWLLLGPLGH
ncbi:MAG: MCE family protein [Streptosporangiaceae bacterium]